MNVKTWQRLTAAALALLVWQAASMAVPAYDVLHNIFLSPDLTQTEQRQLAGAFYRAYRTQMNGRTQPLDERLGDTLGRLLE